MEYRRLPLCMFAGKTSKLTKRNRDSQAKMVVVYVILMSQSMQCHVSRSYVPVWMTVLSKTTIQSYNTHS